MAALTAKAVKSEHELGMNNGYWVQSKNLILQRKVSRCVEDKELGVAEQVVSDFDGFSYQLQEGEGATMLSVTVSMPYLGMLRENGLDAMLKTKYGDYGPNWPTENSFEISLDVAAPPASPEAVTEAVASLRHECLAAPLSAVFSELAAGEPSTPAFHYCFGSTGKHTPTFVVPSKDRVVIVYVMAFEDKTDRQIARVFLQEFADVVKKTRSGAPPMSYSPKDAPKELAPFDKSTYRVDAAVATGFVSFPIFRAHVENEAKMRKTLLLLNGFQTYLYYHIKATKMYMHMSMRKRVRESLEVLRKAKPKDPHAAKKTAGGKSFQRR